MFNRYLPKALYRRLPGIYLLVASALLAAPLSPLKWLPIAALGVAALLTMLLRLLGRLAPGQESGMPRRAAARG